MRLSLRFVIPLALALAALAYAVTPLVDRLTERWFTRDLDLRSTLIANAIDGPLSMFVSSGNPALVRQYFERIARDERLYAIGLCTSPTAQLFASSSMPPAVRCSDAGRFAKEGGNIISTGPGPLLVSVVPVPAIGGDARLILMHDMSFITRRSEETRR